MYEIQTNQFPPPSGPYQPPQTPLPLGPRSMLADEVCKLAARMNTELATHMEKKFMDETAAVRLLELKADCEIRKQLLVSKIFVDADGELVRSQEFMREKKRSYHFCNFRVMTQPIIYTNPREPMAILSFSALQQNTENVVVCLNLQKSDAGYFWRKFRNAGLQIKKKHGERAEVIFEVIEGICDMAKHVELPRRHGFYMNESGNVAYAGKEDLTWEEVSFNANCK